MKKLCTGTPVLLFILLSLSGCNTVGSKAASQSIIYSAAAVLSLLLGLFPGALTDYIGSMIAALL